MSGVRQIVAITGRSGSGKSTVAQFYRERGFWVADADLAARAVLQPGGAVLRQLAECFGDEILLPDGRLDRAQLALRAFADARSTQLLNDTTHPAIARALLLECEACWSAGGHALCFVDGAAIVGQLFEQYCSKVVVVTVSQAQAVKRIMQRDGISRQMAQQRLQAQTPQRALCAAADYVIENNAGLPQLKQQAQEVLERLCGKGAT